MFSFWTLIGALVDLNSIELWWLAAMLWVKCEVSDFAFESGSLELVKNFEWKGLERTLDILFQYFAPLSWATPEIG